MIFEATYNGRLFDTLICNVITTFRERLPDEEKLFDTLICNVITTNPLRTAT